MRFIGFLQAALYAFPVVFPVAATPATITLYDIIEPTITEIPHLFQSLQVSDTILPVGVNQDGKTVYDQVVAVTGYVYEEPQNLKIITSTPATPLVTTLTRVEDASGYELHYTVSPFVLGKSCTFQGTTRGSCVDSQGYPSVGSNGSTYFSTFTGVPTPVFTYVETQVSAATTISQGYFKLMARVVTGIVMLVLGSGV